MFRAIFGLLMLACSPACVTADEIAAASGTISPEYDSQSARKPTQADGVTVQFNPRTLQRAELRISPLRLLEGKRTRQALKFCSGRVSYDVIGNNEYPRSPSTLRAGGREVPFRLFRREFLRDYGAPLEIWTFSAYWIGAQPATELTVDFRPGWEYVVDGRRYPFGGGRVPAVVKDPIEAIADGAPYWFRYRWWLAPISNVRGELKWPALARESAQLRGFDRWLLFDTWGDATELEPREQELHPPYLEVELGECL